MHRSSSCFATIAGVGLIAIGVAGCGAEARPPEADTGPRSAVAPASTPSQASNRPPEIHGLRFEPADAGPGDRVSATVEVIDPDGDEVALFHRWRLNGERFGNGQAAIRLPESAIRARLELEVIASDGHGPDASARIARSIDNRPPQLDEIDLEPSETLSADETARVRAAASDPDGDEISLRFTWLVNGRPVPHGTAELTNRWFQRGDAVAVEVVASDGDDESAPLRTPELRVVNSPPRIVSKPEALRGDGSFHYAVVVDDPDGDRRLRYRLDPAPAGMTVDWLQGVVRWKPRADQTGRHPVRLFVDDQNGGIAQQDFVIDVALEPEPPETPAAPAR